MQLTPDSLRSAWNVLAEIMRHFSDGSSTWNQLCDTQTILEAEARVLGADVSTWHLPAE
jgi:hypothetical protein